MRYAGWFGAGLVSLDLLALVGGALGDLDPNHGTRAAAPEVTIRGEPVDIGKSGS